MKKELEKTYNPSENEDDIYNIWEKSGFFNPDNLELAEDAERYTIVLPPPNITDKLHVGHGSIIAIEDLLIRYNRLLGKRTLWLPGTDHAAIATQNVVEKKIFKEKSLTRHDLGKEDFLKEVWGFLEETQNKILFQARKMGASLDWSRTAFTLDEKRKLAVRKMFFDMYNEGIIYRGERLVNWCPRCQSTLADDEVEYKEQDAGFYTFRYDKNFPISISTTRPETKLGDTAIAVNPKDDRYKKYIGETLQAVFCGQKLNIKVVADYQVDQNFGTGALGVTPAHSLADAKIAQENNLETIKVINEEGLIKDGFGRFSGMTAIEARNEIVKELKESGLIEKEEIIKNNLSICYRCDSAIEPLFSKQWFVSVDKKIKRLGNKSLKEKAAECAENKKITFIPERFGKIYLDWINNLHDWCISRQIWFGHEIPVWYRNDEVFVGLSAPDGDDWQQDPDTLDTWFSSGMWTFSTLGWPENYKNGEKIGDLKKFHPNQVLETGYEIITLWVSRMIMMSLFALEEIPFEKVYLHGMILDKNGKKMSKSKGNGIDPLEVIKSYGTDAVRLALLMGSTPGNDLRFSEEKTESKRNLINKIWNISRFILTLAKEKNIEFDQVKPEIKTLSDEWIFFELEETIKTVTDHLNNFSFSLAAEALTVFSKEKLADWYLEIAKIEKDKENNLVYILKTILVLWHPFIPFVTETIWQSSFKSLLMVANWPKVDNYSKEEKKEFNIIKDIIVLIRNIRNENKIEAGRKIEVVVYANQNKELVEREKALICGLKTGVSSIRVEEDGEKIDNALLGVVAGIEVYILSAIDKEKELNNLKKEELKLEGLINNQLKKLENKEFVDRAPEKIVTVEKEKLELYKLELEKIKKNIETL